MEDLNINDVLKLGKYVSEEKNNTDLNVFHVFVLVNSSSYLLSTIVQGILKHSSELVR